MVNPLRGEVELLAGETYTLRLGTNALVEIGSVLGGIAPGDIGPRMIAPETQAETVRAVLWGALGGSRSGLTLFDAGDMIDEYPEQVGAAINEVFRLAMPDLGVGKNPRKPSAGTGKSSLKAGSRSASTRKLSGR
jgi:hypothetical protein